jgi:hypothetical protein
MRESCSTASSVRDGPPWRSTFPPRESPPEQGSTARARNESVVRRERGSPIAPLHERSEKQVLRLQHAAWIGKDLVERAQARPPKRGRSRRMGKLFCAGRHRSPAPLVNRAHVRSNILQPAPEQGSPATFATSRTPIQTGTARLMVGRLIRAWGRSDALSRRPREHDTSRVLDPSLSFVKDGRGYITIVYETANPP